jgi:hypothetical protein
LELLRCERMSGRLEQTVNLAPICRLSTTALVCSRVRFLVVPQLLTRAPPSRGGVSPLGKGHPPVPYTTAMQCWSPLALEIVPAVAAG